MRVLHLISALAAGGAETLVRDLSVAMVTQGHQIAVAFISSAKQQGNSSEFEASFVAALSDAGIAVFEIGHRLRRSPIRGGMRLREIIKTCKPDVLHVHLATGLLYRLCSLLPTPTVYTHHNIVFSVPSWLFVVLDLQVASYVAICDSCMQALAIRTRRPVALIRNAISTRNVVPRRTQSDDEITVLAVGALTPQKDYPTLIRVAALVYPRVRATGRTIRFLVAGDGAAIAQLRAMVIEANLAGVVEFLGARRDVPELMSSASLLLMTSKFEGLPISLIEGLHAALPLIAPDVGGCNEMVKSGVNGFLTAPGDVAQIADRVLEIITNPNTIEAMSCESKLLAVEFSLDECVRKHIALYERVLEAAG